LLLLQATLRLRVLPEASLSVAVSWVVPPTVTEAEEGLTSTEATGTGVTVTEAVSLLPSEVAVMVAVPWATPVTRPSWETVATPLLLLLQATLRLRVSPEASLSVAVSWVVPPTVTEALEGAISTEATGTGVISGPVMMDEVECSAATP
jgi:hypothetical protein